MSAQQATLAPYPLLPNAMVHECTSNTRRFWLRGRRLTEAFLNRLLAMGVGCIEHKVFIRGAPSGNRWLGRSERSEEKRRQRNAPTTPVAKNAERRSSSTGMDPRNDPGIVVAKAFKAPSAQRNHDSRDHSMREYGRPIKPISPVVTQSS